MLEQPGAVLEQIPDDEDVQPENQTYLPHKAGMTRDDAALDEPVMVDQFKNFDGNEKR